MTPGTPGTPMILMRSNIPPNFNPVAIGASQFGETCLQIAPNPQT